VRDKLLGLAWLGGAGLLFLGSLAVTATVAVLPAFLAPLNLLGGLALGTSLFLWSSTVLCNRSVGWRALLPGALLGAFGFEILKALGSFLLPRIVAHSSALYGSIGTVFAVLAWLFLFGRLVVFASVLNVVLWERGHGTVTVGVEVPRLPGMAPTTGTRSGEAST
jgi:membrane protein